MADARRAWMNAPLVMRSVSLIARKRRARLARVDPDYSMGRVLAEISEQAIPPSRWEEFGQDIQAELRAEFALLAG